MFSSYKLMHGLGVAAMVLSMTTATALADSKPQPAGQPGQPANCTTTVYTTNSKAGCPVTQPTGDPQGLSHTMTGGNFVVPACIGSRDSEPMDILVASLDDGIVIEKLRKDMQVATMCCDSDYRYQNSWQDDPIVASIGADFVSVTLPAHVMRVAC